MVRARHLDDLDVGSMSLQGLRECGIDAYVRRGVLVVAAHEQNHSRRVRRGQCSLTGCNSQSSDTPSGSDDDSSLNRPGSSHDDRHRDDADAILVGKVGPLRDIDGHDLLTL